MKYGFNIIGSDEDKGYIATCPDFPGLSAFGESEGEALEEAKVALELFIDSFKEDGEPLPEPTKESGYSGQFRLRLAKSFHRALSRLAKREGVSLNSFVVHLLAIALGKKEMIEEIKPQLRRIEESRSTIIHFTNTVNTHIDYDPTVIEPYAVPKRGGEVERINKNH